MLVKTKVLIMWMVYCCAWGLEPNHVSQDKRVDNVDGILLCMGFRA